VLERDDNDLVNVASLLERVFSSGRQGHMSD